MSLATEATETDPRANGTAERPFIPSPIARPTRVLFRTLSRLRGKRIFHPDGVLFGATLRVPKSIAGYTDVPLLEGPARHRAVVRLSRAIGLPPGMPDILGIGLRLVDLYGPGRHQDLLLVSSGSGPLIRHAFLPGTRGFFGHSFSTLLPYSVDGRARMIALAPPPRQERLRTLDSLRWAAPGTTYSLRLASLTGGWEEVAELEIGEQRPDREAEELELNPWNTGGGLRPTGPAMGMRGPAYEGSQQGRGARR